MPWAILGTATIGCSVALAVYAGRESIARGIAFVEADLRDKLRRLRINARHLHQWVVVWLVTVLVLLLGLTFAFGSLPFGIVSASLLFCVPWYLVRRRAEQRRLKIEDQLADAMVALASAIKAGLSLGQALE